VRRQRLSTPLLLAMTEARAFDLYEDPMPDEAALLGYLTKTEGAPFALALTIVGADAPPALADHAGRAFGLTRILATLPLWLSKGRLPFPQSQLTKAGVTADALLQGQASPALAALLESLMADITADLAMAQRLSAPLSRPQRVPLLPLATIQPYLKGIRASARDPLRTVTEISPLARIARIARAHWLGL
jgi:15-cis-phytoene synthase